MNLRAIQAIYGFEMARFRRTIFQSLFTPVLTTSLYFIVFGSAMGGRLHEVQGVPYGQFIIPGLMLLAILSESVSNASFGIYLPRFTGTIYELLSAPVGTVEALAGYVGAAASKSLILALVILGTARLFVPYHIAHPLWAIIFLILITISFCLFGFILGCMADGFEKLQVVPLMVVTPLTFLGGTFYSVEMLPKPWSIITLFNPIVYLVNGLRWAFYGIADVNIAIAAGLTCLFLIGCVSVVSYIFATGWRLRT